jgi:DNA-binding transcriptional MerR regulator
MKAIDVATLAGISKETLRYYEKIGLISVPARQQNGYRSYDRHVLEELRFIKLGQTVGFTLNEIKVAIPSLRTPDPKCPRLIEALELQLARVNEKMAELADAKMLLARWLNKLTR